MIAMRMMQVTVHQIVDVVAMGHRFVPTTRAVLMCAAGFGRASHWVRGADRDHVLVNMVFVHVMEMPIMKIVNVPVVTDRNVSAVRAMVMRVVGMMLLGAGGHGYPFPVCS